MEEKKVYIESLGCQMNKSDTERLEGMFLELGYEKTLSAKDADFVCIEPWCGIADSVDTTGDIMKKEGIHILIPGEIFTRTWSVSVH